MPRILRQQIQHFSFTVYMSHYQPTFSPTLLFEHSTFMSSNVNETRLFLVYKSCIYQSYNGQRFEDFFEYVSKTQFTSSEIFQKQFDSIPILSLTVTPQLQTNKKKKDTTHKGSYYKFIWKRCKYKKKKKVVFSSRETRTKVDKCFVFYDDNSWSKNFMQSLRCR